MKADAWRYEPDDDRPPPAVYWRRRFVALVTGLAVLGTVAWAFSGAVGGGGSGTKAADAGHAPGSHRTGAATGTRALPGIPAPEASTQGTPSPGGSVPLRGVRQVAAASPARSGPPACQPGDVVLSVFPSQDSYGPGQPPEFEVYVVSTSDKTCAFNVGPRYLTLVVTAGRTPVWDSADCAAAPGSVVTDLARGVPAMLPVAWDLQSSAPGCTAAPKRAATGTYAATASDDGTSSSAVTFRVS
jgi:hypothetical protein